MPSSRAPSHRHPRTRLYSVNECHRMAQIISRCVTAGEEVMRAPQTVERAKGGAAVARAPAPRPDPHPHLITDITVEHGSVDILGRFFLKADTAARARGLTMSFGTFEELLEVNRKNRA